MITPTGKIKFTEKRGIALLLTLGILAVLSMIGTAFVLSGFAERKQATNYLDSVKAKYIAEAGIARAIAELKYGTNGAVNSAITVGPLPTYTDLTIIPSGEYTVTITDCAGQICINDNNPNLARILKNLINILGYPAGLTDADCDNIANGRPYYTKEMIKNINGITQQKYDALSPYITAYAYVDPDVINPLDTATPFALQPRAPINVNTASREVIQAVLMGIRADHCCPLCGGDGYFNDQSDLTYNGLWRDCPACNGTGSLTITQTEAGLIADQIIVTRPFSTWEGFYSAITAFCSSLSYGSSGINRDADLVMANANPNSAASWDKNVGWASKLGYLGKFTIPWQGGYNGYLNHVYQWINLATTGLTGYTTEFSFNSGGYYEITSIGRFRTAETYRGSVKTLKSIVKTFDIYRETTQQQFERGTISNIDDLATYPENRKAGVAASQFDGQIMLSRLPPYSQPSGAPGSNYFRANYRDRIDADSGGGNPALVNPALPAASMPNIGSLYNFSNRGDLAPDGLLIDDFNTDCPAYLPVGNISENEGTMEIWFKPRWKSNDSVGYGSRSQNKFMLRAMSKDVVPGTIGYPFVLCFFWSDYNYLWFGGIRGSGVYGLNPNKVPLDPPGTPPYWYWKGPGAGQFGGFFTQNGEYIPLFSFDDWMPGEWRQLVFSWKGPVDPLDPASYSATPTIIYMNGVKKSEVTDQGWNYHTPYTNDDPNRQLQLGNEADSWIGPPWNAPGVPMVSDSVIGSVRIWNYKLTDNEVRAEFERGYYKTSGAFTSSIVRTSDLGITGSVEWGTVTWTQAIPDGTAGTITLDVDTGSGIWAGNYANPASGNPISNKSNSIRYRASFASGLAGGGGVEQDRQVLVNPGFEDGRDVPPEITLPYPWSGTQSFLASTEKPYTGGFRSAKWIPPTVQMLGQNFYVEQGRNYKLRMYSYVTGGAISWPADRCYVKMDLSGGIFAFQNFVNGPYDQWVYTETPWVTAPGLLGAGAPTNGYVLVDCNFSNGRAVYFDDIQVWEQGGQITDRQVDSPVLEDVTITYLPRTKILKQQW